MTIENYNVQFLTAEKVIELLDTLEPHYRVPGDDFTYDASYQSPTRYSLVVISEKNDRRFTIRSLDVLPDTPANRDKVLTEIKSRLWNLSSLNYTPMRDEFAKLSNSDQIDAGINEEDASDQIRFFLDLVHDWFDGFSKIEKIDFHEGPSLRLTWNNFSTKNRDVVTTFKMEDIINDTNGKFLMRQIVQLTKDGHSPFNQFSRGGVVTGGFTTQKVTEPLLGTFTSADIKANGITPDVRNLLHVTPTNPETPHVEYIDGRPTVVPNDTAPTISEQLAEMDEYVESEFSEMWDTVNGLDVDYQNQQKHLTDLEASIRSLTSTQFTLQGSLNKALRDIEELKSAPQEAVTEAETEPTRPEPINIVINTLKDINPEDIAKSAKDTLKSYFKGRL